ncbi:hypothetical protein [Flavobacterium sp. Root420]|uniref:hypothetical protein n=1 Tax=Flavobacterium sp. Root420 TaxID=1736533 RepID=UPI000A4CEFC3|nr:hypothetical protein [Flavobacterium sp. Root420]
MKNSNLKSLIGKSKLEKPASDITILNIDSMRALKGGIDPPIIQHNSGCNGTCNGVC